MSTFFLLVRDSGKEPAIRIKAQTGIEIGRSPECRCVLTDPKVGRKAAKIVEQGGVLYVEDMGSTNRTAIRGVRKLAKGEREILRHGLVIDVGRSSIEIEEIRAVLDDKTDAGDATGAGGDDETGFGERTMVTGAPSPGTRPAPVVPDQSLDDPPPRPAPLPPRPAPPPKPSRAAPAAPAPTACSPAPTSPLESAAPTPRAVQPDATSEPGTDFFRMKPERPVTAPLTTSASGGGLLGRLEALGELLTPSWFRRSPTAPSLGNRINVWYATNRKPVPSMDPIQGYSSERDTSTHYGTCRVFIPKSHRIGSTGSPWYMRWLRRTDDRLRLEETQRLASDAYWEAMRASLAGSPMTERNGVVFIHGYNVSFDQAALRSAQIGFDLGVNGPMSFFSWPSRGSLGGYPADEATIEASEGAITSYLIEFAQRSGVESVHVVAHSMGNRAILRAMDRIARGAGRNSGVRFDQIILAAADVDADTFRELAGAYAAVARRTTLYVSGRDRAIEASGWLHQFSRAGLIPPVTVIPGIDTVCVTNADLTLLGHGYVAESRGVLTDIHALLTTNLGPERRFGLQSRSTDRGERYWEIGA